MSVSDGSLLFACLITIADVLDHIKVVQPPQLSVDNHLGYARHVYMCKGFGSGLSLVLHVSIRCTKNPSQGLSELRTW